MVVLQRTNFDSFTMALTICESFSSPLMYLDVNYSPLLKVLSYKNG